CAGDGTRCHAVRRADVGTRPRDDRRSAQRHEGARRRGDDHGGGDARDDLRPAGRRLGRRGRRGADRGKGRARTDLRGADGRAHARFSEPSRLDRLERAKEVTLPTRVPPVTPGTRSDLAAIEASIEAERGGIPLLYQVLLNSAPIAEGWEKMLTAVRNRSGL